MGKNVESLLKECGLRQVESLSEIVEQQVFFADSNFQLDLEFPVYPISKKANLTHDLLNLYGVHWRYLVKVDDLDKITMQEGDLGIVLNNSRNGTREHRHACYAFTKKYLDENQSLWIFVPETHGWEYYQNTLLPRFKRDMGEYRQRKTTNSKPE